MAMNSDQLVDYGIQNEQSDLRVHVCFGVRIVYIFPTEAGLEAIALHEGDPVPVYRVIRGQRVCTAKGYPIRLDLIRGLKYIQLTPALWDHYQPPNDNSTSPKGKAASDLLIHALRVGLIPIPLDPDAELSMQQQYDGLDIIVSGAARLQVKCDYRGGHRKLGGTGNLFLQVAEQNPLGEY